MSVNIDDIIPPYSMIINFLEGYLNKKIKVKNTVATFLKKIEEEDEIYRSVLHLNENAIDTAKKLDQYVIDHNKLKGRLHGIPFFVKANMKTNDMLPTSCGSLVLEDFFADSDASVIEWLVKEGAVLLGKTNMSEFSNYLSNNSNSGYSSLGGQTISVFGKDFQVGGSSSGSAVAVAASFCSFSIGSETDGSIVYPAAHNGVYAFKFNSKKISKKGIIGISNFFDSIGFFTKELIDLKYLVGLNCDLNISAVDSIRNVFIEESSFYPHFQPLLIKLKNFLLSQKIGFSMGEFIEEIDPFFDYMDIICQTEFKENMKNNLPFSNEEFMEECKQKLVPNFHSDINEIERSFSSGFLNSGEYDYAINGLNELRLQKRKLMKDDQHDLILAITLGPTEISSIANLLDLTHLVIPVKYEGVIPIGFSIMGLPDNESLTFDFAKRFGDYLK